MGARQGQHDIPQVDGAGDDGAVDEGGAAASAPGGAARSLRKRLCIESEESEGEDAGADGSEGAGGGARVEGSQGIKAESDEQTEGVPAIGTPLDHELPADSTLDVTHGPTRQGLAILFETLRAWLSHARALNDVPLAVPDPWHLLASCHVLAAELGFPAASAERPLPSREALEAALERVRASMPSSTTWGSHGEGAHLRTSASAPSPLPGLASPAKGAVVVVEESSGPAVPRLASASNPSSASGPAVVRRTTSTAGGAASGGPHAPPMAKPRKGPSVKDRLQKKLKLR
ncbi:hypothetical protein H632_c2994p0 [Helicosporidium sp. ATCC 50920]|nr:hypothetical protein H632_c2994p0 [Helicosporidium sp. ATCC 50920]|eukprot:KDD72706.1 hypothetical protein H632_c2994p0 [Helicosporidium sp. ATCC 50920]